MTSVLVAGATGYLGRHVVAELHSRRHLVRAVVRDRARACRKGPWGSPSLDGLVEEWAVGSVTDSGFTRDLAADVEHVVSALGVKPIRGRSIISPTWQSWTRRCGTPAPSPISTPWAGSGVPPS